MKPEEHDVPVLLAMSSLPIGPTVKVCVCVSVSKNITILIYRGFHLESNFDEPYISFCLGVVSQKNKVHIYLLLPSVWIVNMTF